MLVWTGLETPKAAVGSEKRSMQPLKGAATTCIISHGFVTAVDPLRVVVSLACSVGKQSGGSMLQILLEGRTKDSSMVDFNKR